MPPFEHNRTLTSVEAAQLFDITNDYVTQLCRRKKVDGHLVGRVWYVQEKSLADYLLEVSIKKAERSHEFSQQLREEYKNNILSQELGQTLNDPFAPAPRYITLGEVVRPVILLSFLLFAGLTFANTVPAGRVPAWDTWSMVNTVNGAVANADSALWHGYTKTGGDLVAAIDLSDDAQNTANLWDAWTSYLAEVLYPAPAPRTFVAALPKPKTTYAVATTSPRATVVYPTSVPVPASAPVASPKVITVAAPAAYANYVTQSSLSAQLKALADSLKQTLPFAPAPQSVQPPTYVYTTLGNSIPNSVTSDTVQSIVNSSLSGYLPLSGGTVTGALALSSQSSGCAQFDASGNLTSTGTACGSGSGGGNPFPSNATSTQIAFNGGATFIGATTTALAVTGSTTISSVLNVNGVLNANGGVAGSLTGNASTATALQTGRTINGITFDGTTNIILTAASSTLLADSNTFSGNNTFSSIITGSVSGNAGTVTNGVYTTTFNSLFDPRFITDLSATTSVASITTLSSLSLPYSQLTGTPSMAGYPFPSNATTTQIAFDGGLTALGATTTALAVTGSTTISGVLNALGTINLGAVTAASFSGAGTGLTGTAAGLSVGGNAGTVTNGIYTTTFNTLFDNRLSASTSISGIATLSNLSLPYSQLTGTPTLFSYPFPSNATSTGLSFNGGATSTSFAVTGSTTISSNFNSVFANLLGSTTLIGNSLFSNATTSSFAVSNISSGSLLKTTTGGSIVAAVAGTDYLTTATIFGFPFTPSNSFYNTLSNSTTTPLSFTQGIFASSTSHFNAADFINATSSAFAVTGSSTVSSVLNVGSNALFNANVGIGSSTPWAKLALAGGNFIQTAGNPVIASSTNTTNNVNDVFVSGRYAYLAEAGTTDGLVIMDISNPAAPVKVGTYTSANNLTRVAVSGKYAYLARVGTFEVVDVSNTAAPSFVGSVSAGFSIKDIYVSGKYVYVTEQASFSGSSCNIRVIDVSNPTSPIVGTALQLASGANCSGLVVSGKFAYVGRVGSRLYVVDISIPTSPTLISTFTTTNAVNDVYVSGRYAYLAENSATGGLQIVDVSNPASPASVASFNTTNAVIGIKIAGNYAYLAENGTTDGVQVVDVSTASAPVVVGTFTTANAFSRIAVSGKYIYLAEAGTTSGFQVLDASGISVPLATIGHLNTTDLNVDNNGIFGGDLYAQGGLSVGISGIFSRGTIAAYIASSTQSRPTVANFIGGAVGVGTTTPGGLLTAANYYGSSFNNLFNVSSSTASDGSTATDFFTVSNTGSTTVTGAFNSTFANIFASSTLSGSTLFANATGTTLAIIGSSTITGALNALGGATFGAITVSSCAGCSAAGPAFPFTPTTFGVTAANATGTLIGFTNGIYSFASSTIGNGTDATGLTINGGATTTGTAYFAGNVGLGTSSPVAKLALAGGNFIQTAGNPVLASSTNTTNNVSDVFISGRYAYLAENTAASGLQIYDIANPSAPLLVSTFATVAAAKNVTVSGKYAYVSESNRMEIIDVSNPFAPVSVGTAGVFASPLHPNVAHAYISGKYAYIATDSQGDGSSNKVFRVYDISNSAAPVLMSLVTLIPTNDVNAIYVSGNYAYLAEKGTTSGLQIYDISNPASPSLVGSFNTTNNVNAIHVSGKYAYLAENSATGGLQVVDISNPASPTSVVSFNTTNAVNGVKVAGNYAYLAENGTTGGVQVVDVSTPSVPVAVGTFTTANNANKLAISGKYVYVAGNGTTNGFQVLDTSGISVPLASIGNLNTTELNVDNNAIFGGDLYTQGGLSVGISGIFSRGTIAAYVASSTQRTPTVANFIGGAVGIGTTTPGSLLTTSNFYGSNFGNLFTVASSTASDGSTATNFFTISNTGSSTISGAFNSVFANWFASTTLSGSTLFANATGTTLFITGSTTHAGAFNSSASNILASSTLTGSTLLTNATTTALAVTGNSYLAGLVGVGSTTPWAKLSVDTTSLAAGVPEFSVGSSTRQDFLITQAGNVGIGTSTPAMLLDIGLNQNGNTLARINNSSSGSGAVSAFVASNNGTNVNNGGTAGSEFGITGTGWASYGALIANQGFWYNGSAPGMVIMADNASAPILFASGGNAERMRVASNGNVGIGTTSPAWLLSLKSAVSTAQEAIAYDDTNFTQTLTSSVGDAFYYQSGKDALFNDSNLWVCSGGSSNTNGCPSGTPTGQGNLIVETSIGVGSSTPWSAITVGANGAITTTEKALVDGATVAIDWKNGNQQQVTLGGNRTITFANYLAGSTLRLMLCQDGTGSRTVTWPGGGTLLWPGGTAPTLTTTANKCDVITFLASNGTSTLKVFGSSVLNF